MTADEIAHRPREITAEDMQHFGSEICFVGTWMPERGPFIRALLRAGLPVSIWGNHWWKAACWREIQPCWCGPAVNDADEYAKIIQTSRIALGLLSKGNRDQHTTRTMEIPALGGLLCAERTNEHQTLYEEGHEAVFWRDADECVALCRMLLASPARRCAIADAGRARQLRNGMFNETMIAQILARLLGSPEPAERLNDHEVPA
jgi:spore maturation protein CgeB